MIALWASESTRAAAARAALRPVAAAWGSAMRLRRALADRDVPRRWPLPLPSVGVGSLLVGGAGKTPVASWVASWFVRRDVRPAIVLRHYGGGDEALLHAALEPAAVVVADANRHRGARRAVARGAEVLVLDDNAQHLRVRPDVQLLLFSTESFAASDAVLPAGPWREPWTEGVGDLLVLTAKRATGADVEIARTRLRHAYPDTPVAVARLAVTHWEPLRGVKPRKSTDPRGRRLFALCGVADSRPFLQQVRQIGDLREAHALRDHARYRLATARRLARRAETAGVDYVVTTAKDAVKLRHSWPEDAPPVLVAQLAVRWETGEQDVMRSLDRCLAARKATPA